MEKIKSIIAATMLIALGCASFAPSAFGGDTIDVTLTPSANANITVNQTTWHPGCGIGETNQTAADWGTCTNDGNVQCDVTINITEDAGTVWEILDIYSASPGNDEVAFSFYNGTAWPVLNEAGDSFGTIAYGSSQTFGLNVSMPDSTSTNTDQTFTITFEATPYSG